MIRDHDRVNTLSLTHAARGADDESALGRVALPCTSVRSESRISSNMNATCALARMADARGTTAIQQRRDPMWVYSERTLRRLAVEGTASNHERSTPGCSCANRSATASTEQTSARSIDQLDSWDRARNRKTPAAGNLHAYPTNTCSAAPRRRDAGGGNAASVRRTARRSVVMIVKTPGISKSLAAIS